MSEEQEQPETEFTPEQRAHAEATHREPSHDVADPTHSDIIGGSPAGVVDVATAIAHATRHKEWTKVPNDPRGHWARPDGTVGPYQKP